MKLTSEIYLTKKCVSENEWLELINVVSKYNGLFKRWKLIVLNDKNQIRYFAKTVCSLPATINNLNSFLLKPVKDVSAPKQKYTLYSLPDISSNIIELINYNEIKNRGTLVYFEVNFLRLHENINKSKVMFYLKKDEVIKKYVCLFSIPATLLSIDFEGNKRFFYKGPPKYLEISKILHLLKTDSNNALLSIDTFPYLQGRFYLNQNSFDFDKHSIIMGSSGCGKSKFICSFIDNIRKCEGLFRKYKFVVIDPHASMENDIGGMGKVIDFKDKTNGVDLFINSRENIISVTELLLDLFKSLIQDQYNSKLERVLRHSIHFLLTAQEFNFRNLRKLLLDLEYRNELIKKYSLPVSVVDFFLSDFNDLKTKSYGEAISPIIGFIDEMELIPVFNSEEKNNNLESIIRDNFLVLFSLDRVKLGDKVIKTISGLIMQQLLSIIEKREIDEHIIFIIDEVAVVENPILSSYLSESRKYNLSLILAGQYFNQISQELQNSIFANVINYFVFRVSKLDANTLVDSFNMKIPLGDTREKKVQLLTELSNRECISRVSSNGVLLGAFKGTTLDYVSVPRKDEPIKEDNVEQVNDFKQKTLKTGFSISSNVSLKNILVSNSTGKKGV